MIGSRSYRRAISAAGGADAALSTEGLDWFASNACTYAFYNATTPPAFYDAVGNTTWFAYEAWNFTSRLLVVCTYNHTTGVWAGPYTAITSPMVDDDHGVPALCMDSNGYVGIMGGSHNATPCLFAVTTNPRDPTAWSSTINLHTGTYPHPSFVGGVWYIFFREGTANTKLLLRKSTAIVAGVPTFTADIEIGDFGTNTRWYQGTNIVVGTDIHMLATRANAADTTRQDVYYVIYNTLNGSVRNYAGDVTVTSGSLPVALATLNASFRIVDQTTGSTQGTIPQMVHIGGLPHIVYMNGSVTTYKLYHVCYNGSAWTSPLEIGDFPSNDPLHRYDGFTISASVTAGDVDIWWCATSGSFTRGGKIAKRTRAANGTLSAQSDVQSPQRTFTLDPVVAVKDGRPDFRVVFAEASDASANERQLRVYVAGDSGVVKRPIAAPASINIDFTTASYGGATLHASRNMAGNFADTAAGAWTIFAADTLRQTNKGLLVEPSRTNILQQSRTLSTAPWILSGVAVTTNQIADADATTTMALVNKSTASTFRRAANNRSATASLPYAFAGNFKAGTLGLVSIRIVSGAQVTCKVFNLTTGAITDVTGTPETTNLVSVSAQALTSGIWRCAIVVTLPVGASAIECWVCPGDAGLTTTGTIYAGSLQLEQETTATSALTTLASSVTRPADDIYFGVPANVTTLTYTFDDNSTQQDTVTNHGAYKIPTNLNRRYIKTIVGSP